MKTVAFTGGGTLGHLYPALAVLERLKEVEPATRIIYFSTLKEVDLLTKHQDIDQVYAIDLQGWKRKLSPANIKMVFKLRNAIKKVKKILKEEKVDLVVGMGGYVSGAVIFAAYKRRIPSLIHEQNACLGLANKISLRLCQKAMMSFPIMLNHQKVIYTGHPRKDQVEKKYQKKDSAGNKILITSGSGGAKVVNEVASKLLLDKRSEKYDITLVTGNKYYQEVMEKLNENNDHFQVVPFIKDLPRAINEVDLVITRAGATTIFEILGLKVPAIYIPSPNVVGNHQEKNASYISKYHLGEVILEKNLSKDELIKTIENVLSDKDYPKRIKENVDTFIKKNAEDEILKEIRKWW